MAKAPASPARVPDAFDKEKRKAEENKLKAEKK